MDIIVFSDRKSWVHALDPRARIIAAFLLTLPLSQAQSIPVLLAGCFLGVVGLIVARVPLAAILQRVVPLNALMFFLLLVMTFNTPGPMLFRVGPAVATLAGLHHGMILLLKGNAIVTLLTCLTGTIEFVALGRALGQLYVPEKLVTLLLFTVRYINLMLAEFQQLSQAALLRGFRPGANLHTMRTTGYLIGMVLVRSYERGARMLAAMKLRGYDGHHTWIDSTPFLRRDLQFVVCSALLAVAIIGAEFR